MCKFGITSRAGDYKEVFKPAAVGEIPRRNTKKRRCKKMDRMERRNELIHDMELIHELIASYEEDGEQITVTQAQDIIADEFDFGEIE